MIINWGDAPFKAFITVTYPLGTCTVSLGDKTFTHTGGGTHTFVVNKKGDWLVKTDSDIYDDSKTVSITKLNETISVTMEARLFYYGSYYVSLKDIKSPQGSSYARELDSNKNLMLKYTHGNNSGTGRGLTYTSSKIDLTGVSYIKAAGGASLVVFSSVPNDPFGASYIRNAVNTIDVTALKGSYYIGLASRGSASALVTTYVNNWRLE